MISSFAPQTIPYKVPVMIYPMTGKVSGLLYLPWLQGKLWLNKTQIIKLTGKEEHTIRNHLNRSLRKYGSYNKEISQYLPVLQGGMIFQQIFFSIQIFPDLIKRLEIVDLDPFWKWADACYKNNN